MSIPTATHVELSLEVKGKIENNRKRALELKAINVAAAAATTTTGVTSAAETVRCCICCTSDDIDKTLLGVFDEKICSACKSLPDQCGDYELINKTEVASAYLITSDSISLMPYIEKTNPRNSNWVPMKMYLRKHARIKAIKRWGSADALLDEIDRRKKSKFEHDVDVVDDIFSSSTLANISSSSKTTAFTLTKSNPSPADAMEVSLLPTAGKKSLLDKQHKHKGKLQKKKAKAGCNDMLALF